MTLLPNDMATLPYDNDNNSPFAEPSRLLVLHGICP